MGQDPFKILLYTSIPLLCLVLLLVSFFSKKTPPPIKTASFQDPEPFSSPSSPSRSDLEKEINTPVPSENPSSKQEEPSSSRSENTPSPSENSKEEEMEKPGPPPDRGNKVVEGLWGSGAGQFGKNALDEKKVPAGFFVDKKNQIWVLDQENYRVQIFSAQGELLKTIPLTSNGYDFLTVDPATSRLALYQGQNRKVEILNPDGSLWKEYSISADFEPITNVFLQDGQLYIERSQGQYYQYNSSDSPPKALPGRPLQKGLSIEIMEKEPGQMEVICYQENTSSGEFQKSWSKALPMAASEILSYQTDDRGNIYILYRQLIQEEQDGQMKTVLDEVHAIQLDSQGNYLGDVQMENRNFSGRQSIVVSGQGQIYQMTNSPEKMQISSFSIVPK